MDNRRHNGGYERVQLSIRYICPAFMGKYEKIHKGAGKLKIYYICEYCERVFQELEVEGEEGSVEVAGICEECALDMGITSSTLINQHYYS